MTKHTHKFTRIGQYSKIWRCAVPDCRWFVHLGLQHVLLGKYSICWGCDEPFLVDERALKDDMPKCIDCRLLVVPPLSNTQPTPTPEMPQPPTTERTPEQQKAYEKEMREMFGKEWKQILGGQ